MNMNQKKRDLELWEQEECAALKAAIESRNRNRPKNERITQEQAGAALGMNQGSFSNYLNGRLALNAEFAIKVSELFQIPIEVYSPRLANDISNMSKSFQQHADELQRDALRRFAEASEERSNGDYSLSKLDQFFNQLSHDDYESKRSILKSVRNMIAHGHPAMKPNLSRLLYVIGWAVAEDMLNEQERALLNYIVVMLAERVDEKQNKTQGPFDN